MMRVKDYHQPHQAQWWSYQKQLASERVKRQRRKRLKTGLAFLLLVLLATFGVLEAVERLPLQLTAVWSRNDGGQTRPAPPEYSQLQRADLRSLLQSQTFLNLQNHTFDLTTGLPLASIYGDKPANPEPLTLQVQTTLDDSLQQHLLQILNPAHARYISLVALDPFSGRIKALVSFDRLNNTRNTCVEALFPAASIFKIITAAGAVEAHGLGPDSELFFNGGKYTLYRSQLAAQRNRHSNLISLADSFAESINPVFGKIGVRQLGRAGLEQFGEMFGFRQPIDFELPLPVSELILDDDTYQWAEVASGFNRTTLITPLHGSMIVAAVVNGGVMMTPSIVEHITTASGQVLYRRAEPQKITVISAPTAQALKPMMAATVVSGTARNLFRGYRSDRILSQLELGGKTGSISNNERTARFDWYVGYGLDAKQGIGLVVAAVVGHEEYIGKRAAEYARSAIRHYFSNYFESLTVAEGEKTKTRHLQ